jgi:fatty acid-binding protein DegV
VTADSTARSSIAIVTDASADVPLVERDSDEARGVTWVVLPEWWHVDGSGAEDVRDSGDSSATLTRLALDQTRRAEPAEPAWDAFCEVYARLREVDRVFSIHAPSNVSWAIEHAREAAGGFPNVRVIEASVTGIGLGLLAAMTRNLAASGAAPDEVEFWLRAHRESVRMLVVPDRFDPLASQRGLSTRLLARSSGMLQSPSEGGSLNRSHRLRSRKATVAAIERYLLEHTSDAIGDESPPPLHLALGHGDAAGAVDPFLDMLERVRPGAQVELVGRVGPRLVQQLGARCVAAAWLEDQPLGTPDC